MEGGMFLTQSIQRKLGFGLGLVLVMLAVLSVSGLYGLSSYRDLVNDPAIDERTAVSAADVTRSALRVRLALPRGREHGATARDIATIIREIEADQESTARYRGRLHELPQALREQQPVAWQMLGEVDHGLQLLAEMFRDPAGQTSRVFEPDLALAAKTAARVELAAAELPELPDGLRDRLKSARRDYRSSLGLVLASSLIVFGLCLWLIAFGIRHILRPVQELHQGARRVAQRDFDYRVSIQSPDEMGELAESFNLMTERFQEVMQDLDRQVQERSRQLVRSERLASVGFLAAGVAHEINNPLTAIRWSAESLESRLSTLLKDASDDEAAIVKQYLGMIQSESERCQAITRRLLDFSRDQNTEKVHQNLTVIVRETLSLITHIRRYLEARIEFTHTEPCELEINGHEIKQVILNLAANALDATSGSGVVKVEIIEQVDWVELRFTDNGCGMTPETISNLFEPFFTTKPTGQGTGLGLSISHRIVTDHQGRIEVRSEGPGLGSTFIVHLPRTQKLPGPQRQPTATEIVAAISAR